MATFICNAWSDSWDTGDKGGYLYPCAGVDGWTLGEDSIWRKGAPAPRNYIQMVAEPASPAEEAGGGWFGKGPGPLGPQDSFPESDAVWICPLEGDGRSDVGDGRSDREDHVHVRVPSEESRDHGRETEDTRDTRPLGVAEMEQFRLFQKWMRMRGETGFLGEGASGRTERPQVHLDEKYFRRVDKFDGDPSKYRGWIFELVVALGQVDGDLQKVVERLVMGKEDVVGKGSVEMWRTEDHMEKEMYQRYSSELYGLLVSLTSGGAKGILKGMLDSRMP